MEYGKFPDEINFRLTVDFLVEADRRPVAGRVGWTYFSLILKDVTGRISATRSRSGAIVPAPVIEGIYSGGGRDVKGWIEVERYLPVVLLAGKGDSREVLSLPGTELEFELLRILAEAVPPGGHLMFAYEVPDESPIHVETLKGLLMNIPPVCTPLGKLLFDAGFRLVKDWFLAEGGFEGPRKLWGEKAADVRAERLYDRRTFFQVVGFCSQKPVREIPDIELAARKRAVQVLTELRLDSSLLELGKQISRSYRECRDAKDLETAARHMCRLVSAFTESYYADEAAAAELAKIAVECSGGFSAVDS